MRMPVVFVGHGSPANALEDNEYTRGWRKIAELLPKPKAVLAVSAHWYTEGTRLQTEEHPGTIHDFYGFPQALYEVGYPAPGAPALARRAAGLLDGARIDNTWGIDHGTWSVLKWMYPGADVPVFQMSVNRLFTPLEAYEAGQRLRPLREEGVLVFGSGNVVHNLRMVDFSDPRGYDWADEFDTYIRGCIEAGRPEQAVDYRKAGRSALLAVPTRDHFDPLLYVLGAAGERDAARVFNGSRVMGSLSMTSYVFSEEE